VLRSRESLALQLQEWAEKGPEYIPSAIYEKQRYVDAWKRHCEYLAKRLASEAS
jgi:hypothetical protein